MTIKKMLILYGLSAVIFFAIDLVWLGVVAKGFYRRTLGGLLADKVNWTAAMLFYLLYIVGILIFAVVPALNRHAAGQAILMGVLFGFFCYATYDLSNLATLKGWPLTVVVVDILWGMIVTGTVAFFSYQIGIRLV